MLCALRPGPASLTTSDRAPLTAFALGVAFALTPAVVVAQPQCTGVDAETLYSQGRAFRDQSRNEEARQVFQRAWDCFHQPRGGARLGITLAVLSSWVEAESHLARALADNNDPWIRQNRDQLATMLNAVREHVGLLEVRCNVEGAQLRVYRGAPRRLPLSQPERVATQPDGVEIEVSAPGYRTHQSRVIVASGAQRVTRVVIALDHEGEGAGTSEGTTTTVEVPSGHTPAGPGALPWVFFGTGLASVLAGTIVLTVPLTVADREREATCPNSVCRPAAIARFEDQGATVVTLSVVGWSLVSAGAVATISGLLWALRRPGATTGAPTAPPLAFGVGLDGTLQLRGVF